MGELKKTRIVIRGYDHESGDVIRKSVYADDAGNEYVQVDGRSTDERRTMVDKEWFCRQILKEQYITSVA